MQFVHVVNNWKDMNLDNGYCLRIDKVEDLIAYFDTCESSRVAHLVERFINDEDTGAEGRYLELLREKAPKKGLVEVVTHADKSKFITLNRLLQSGAVIFLRKNGSYFIETPSTKIVNTRESNTYSWEEVPESRIFQWRKGTHFYAKFGNLDVVDSQGNQKWDTYKEAEAAVREFARKMESDTPCLKAGACPWRLYSSA